MTQPPVPLPAVIFPEDLPPSLPAQKFRLGDSVRWRTVPDPDFGRIVGVIYSPEATHQATGLHYLILIDSQSPSYSICHHDFALETDLEGRVLDLWIKT